MKMLKEAIQAADLNRHHLGRTLAVARGDAYFRDILRAVSHEADLIEERRLFDEVPEYYLGRVTTTLTFVHAGDVLVAGSTNVEVDYPLNPSKA